MGPVVDDRPNVWLMRDMRELADLVRAIEARTGVDRLGVCRAIGEGLRMSLAW
jgi:hypothetical protein